MVEQRLLNENARNYGVDFLRIISMIFVVMLHVLKRGGILGSLPVLSVKYEIAWFMEIACYCAINCYALISGYVGVNSKFKYTNIVNLWLQVIFYSVGFALIAMPILPQKVLLSNVIEGFMPVSNNSYWYFTAYFCIFFFMPIFNKLLSILNKKQMVATGITIVLLFSVLPTFAKTDIFCLNSGYSAIWLALLYILGGIIRKTDILCKIKPLASFGIYLLCVLITWTEKLVIDCIGWGRVHGLQYISPTILFSAIMLLNAFSQLKIKKIPAKIISLLAPHTFGVYLAHVQRQVWSFLMVDAFVGITQCNVFLMVLLIFIAVLGIYLIATAIDAVRALLFRLLHIKRLLGFIESKISLNIFN